MSCIETGVGIEVKPFGVVVILRKCMRIGQWCFLCVKLRFMAPLVSELCLTQKQKKSADLCCVIFTQSVC